MGPEIKWGYVKKEAFSKRGRFLVKFFNFFLRDKRGVMENRFFRVFRGRGEGIEVKVQFFKGFLTSFDGVGEVRVLSDLVKNPTTYPIQEAAGLIAPAFKLERGCR